MNTTLYTDYALRVCAVLTDFDWTPVAKLANDLERIRKSGKQLFICGNGGSAANAVHLANDYLYGIGAKGEKALRVHALSANTAILTCLANDVSYDAVFSEQLKTYGKPGDCLLVLSGSGNSKNILKAIEVAKEMGLHTHAILGFDGGKSKKLADNPIHFEINDMQISEDMQMVVGHMLMQQLSGFCVKKDGVMTAYSVSHRAKSKVKRIQSEKAPRQWKQRVAENSSY